MCVRVVNLSRREAGTERGGRGEKEQEKSLCVGEFERRSEERLRKWRGERETEISLSRDNGGGWVETRQPLEKKEFMFDGHVSGMRIVISSERKGVSQRGGVSERQGERERERIPALASHTRLWPGGPVPFPRQSCLVPLLCHCPCESPSFCIGCCSPALVLLFAARPRCTCTRIKSRYTHRSLLLTTTTPHPPPVHWRRSTPCGHLFHTLPAGC